MKRLSLMFAAAMTVAMLMTGCFGTVEPTPTVAPTLSPTTAPTATAEATILPTATVVPVATADAMESMMPDVTEGLKVAPSPSASTAP